MRNILATRHSGRLEDFAQSNVMLVFDYDGTLTPIAATPRRAHMRAGTRRLLERARRLRNPGFRVPANQAGPAPAAGVRRA